MSAEPDKMPKVMPDSVRRELENVLGFRNTATPAELHNAIRDALERGYEQRAPSRGPSS